MKRIYNKFFLAITATIILSGCEKFLEEKSDKRLSISSTVKDYQALLDNYGLLNTNFCSSGEISADNFYLTEADFNGLRNESDKRLYTWQPDYVSLDVSTGGNEWNNTYKAIYICNSVLEGLEKDKLTTPDAANVKGQALVFRAARLLDGVQIWAPAYNEQTATTDLGMVLRLDPDLNLPSIRSSVKETYDQILKDLNEAVSLLPISQPTQVRPSKVAALGLLARTYLFMGDYAKATEYGENALASYNQLIDFNTLNPNINYPVTAINNVGKETILLNSIYFAAPLSNSIAKISADLYDLYEDNDLRKQIFFRKNADNSYTFKGSLSGGSANLSGITTGELYLILAECNARLNRIDEAANNLNTLLIKRWKSGEFVPFAFSNKETALNLILTERRKELVMRSLRWADIKRLNRDGANITLTRIVGSANHTLMPNDLRYAIAIPEDIIEIAKIPQNPR